METNYSIFKKYLTKIIGEETYNKLIESLGGEEKIDDASFATNADTGLAFQGSLLDTVLKLANYATKINDLLPDNNKVEPRSIYKVCLLSHLSKVIMFKPNENQWAVEKQGKLFEFEDLPGALRFGERSILLAMNAGVQFTPEEFEAMRITEKTDDDYAKYFSSMLAVIVKQANELINAVSRHR